MLDMQNFTLTKHDAELFDIIKPVKQNSIEQKILAIWAIDCLRRILPVYESKYPDDVTLKTAINYLIMWIDDKIKMWDARKYTYTVLRLARTLETNNDKAYAQIVRAASHCLATCHVPTHSEGTAMYVVSAIKHIYEDSDIVISLMEHERSWQINHLKELMRNKKS
jgi:sugar diacid utilization regulator